MLLGKLDIPMQKKKNWTFMLYHSYTKNKNNSKWIKDLNVNLELSTPSKEESFMTLGLARISWV
jgi:hypothetical protein